MKGRSNVTVCLFVVQASYLRNTYIHTYCTYIHIYVIHTYILESKCLSSVSFLSSSSLSSSSSSSSAYVHLYFLNDIYICILFLRFISGTSCMYVCMYVCMWDECVHVTSYPDLLLLVLVCMYVCVMMPSGLWRYTAHQGSWGRAGYPRAAAAGCRGRHRSQNKAGTDRREGWNSSHIIVCTYVCT